MILVDSLEDTIKQKGRMVSDITFDFNLDHDMHRLTVAKEDLETAKDDFTGKHFRAANNRAYYSIYHSITAVLALEQAYMTMGEFN